MRSPNAPFPLREVVVLQQTACEDLGSIEAALPRGVEARYVRLHAGDRVPSGLEGAAGLIVLGGPMGVYEQDRYPFLPHETRLIETALSTNLPILGICLGSQLLASALGQQVRRGDRKEIGWHRVLLVSSPE